MSRSRFGWAEPLAVREAAAAVCMHDFVRHDRGPVDEHWAHVFGALCARCAQLMEDEDIARRRVDGEWVHEHCPVHLPLGDDDLPETRR